MHGLVDDAGDALAVSVLEDGVAEGVALQARGIRLDDDLHKLVDLLLCVVQEALQLPILSILLLLGSGQQVERQRRRG
eukprot:1759554-Alexandrium_andersonii.AAC.1